MPSSYYLIVAIFLQVMYWSGRVTPLVHEFTADARRYITIRDYLPGAEAAWLSYIFTNLLLKLGLFGEPAQLQRLQQHQLPVDKLIPIVTVCVQVLPDYF